MKNGYLYGLLFGLLFILGCNNEQKQKAKTVATDTPEKGTMYISVDESFKPVIEEQIKVYHSSYPDANIIASYKSEADCFRDLQKDSTRMIIVAKELSASEEAYYKSVTYVRPSMAVVAYDAIAVIVHVNASDSVFTLDKLKEVLSGKSAITAVMDGNNATSTVRYLKDSLLKGKPFGANVVAANGSEAVIDVVSKQPNSIGFVGLSWVGNKYDSKQQENLKKIKFALVECSVCEEKGVFAKPSQATITYLQYPLARPLYYIHKEAWTGLATGFAAFMMYERGQLIFRRSFLAPARIDFNKRRTKIDES